jgi:hypothetical protein
MKINKLLLFIACLAAGNAQAIDLGYGFTIKGFGTGGLVHSSTGNADFVVNDYLQANGAGYSNGASLVVDSKLGIQLDYQATDRLSFVAQGLAKQQYNSSLKPVLEWAYAKFQIIPELNIRVGRIRPAVYMLSDYLDVNYANPWVRPPVEFYSTVPIDRMEGVDFLWRPSTGNISWLVQPYYGNTQLGITGTGNSFKANNILGINLAATYNDLTLRAGFTETTLNVTSPAINTGLTDLTSICNTGLDQNACYQYGPASLTNKNSSFSSLGFNWDNGDYFVMGEFGKRTTKTYAVSDATTWYISGGARIWKFAPYISFSSYHDDDAAAYTSDLNNVFNLGLGADVNQIITRILQNNAQNQNTITLGTRYDFMPNLALKCQWDHIQTTTKGGVAGTGTGLFANVQPGFGNGPTQVDLFSVTLDFVF